MKRETGMQDQGTIFLRDPSCPSVVENIVIWSYASRMEKPQVVDPGNRQNEKIGNILYGYLYQNLPVLEMQPQLS